MDVAANLPPLTELHKATEKNNSVKMKKLKTPVGQHTWSNKKHVTLIQKNFFRIFSPPAEKPQTIVLKKNIKTFSSENSKTKLLWYFISKTITFGT